MEVSRVLRVMPPVNLEVGQAPPLVREAPLHQQVHDHPRGEDVALGRDLAEIDLENLGMLKIRRPSGS